jgi:thioredoxin 1
MLPKKPLILASVLAAATACGATTGSDPVPAGRTVTSAPAAAASTPTPQALPDGYDPTRNAEADIAAALAKARVDRRPVLLDFGADWCPDCVVLEHTVRTNKVGPVIGHFHVVAIDVGRFDRHLALARKYHLDLRASGIPALVVLSHTGKVRTTTNDGSFANARTMTAGQVAAFLKRWQ